MLQKPPKILCIKSLFFMEEDALGDSKKQEAFKIFTFTSSWQMGQDSATSSLCWDTREPSAGGLQVVSRGLTGLR